NWPCSNPNSAAMSSPSKRKAKRRPPCSLSWAGWSTAPANYPNGSCYLAGPLQLQFLSGQPLVCLKILGARPGHDLSGELRARGRFVPIERLQIIPHELLVETGLGFARRILIGWPEA